MCVCVGGGGCVSVWVCVCMKCVYVHLYFHECFLLKSFVISCWILALNLIDELNSVSSYALLVRW